MTHSTVIERQSQLFGPHSGANLARGPSDHHHSNNISEKNHASSTMITSSHSFNANQCVDALVSSSSCDSLSLASSSTLSLVTASSSSLRHLDETSSTSQQQVSENTQTNNQQQARSSCSSASSLACCSIRSGQSSSSTAQQQSQEEEEEEEEGDISEQENNNNNNDFKQKSVATKLKRYLSMMQQQRTNNNNDLFSRNGNKMQQKKKTATQNEATTKMQMQHKPKIKSSDDIEQLLTINKRTIQITTCAKIYNQWRQTKRLYHKAPNNGIQLEVDYIDTGVTLDQHIRDRAPIVLTLHGAPGSYNDFGLLIQHLAGQTIRVIAPNFPEYTTTVKTKTLFRHSADEKASYLRDFLRAINVNRIDLLVSHSSAVFPSLLILLNDNPNYEYKLNSEQQVTQQHLDSSNYKKSWIQQVRPKQLAKATSTINHYGNQSTKYNIEIRALALFNPAGHRLPQSMKPTWFKCGSVRIYQNKFGRALFQKFGTGFLTIVGVPVRVDNMDHVMLSATVMRNSECQRMVQQLNYLNQLKFPTLLVFSENDKLIEKDIFYEMTQFMGINRNHFDIFNHQGEIELTQSSSDEWIRVMVFKAGGHYAYSNYAKTVNKAVTELLCKVCSCTHTSSPATTTTSQTSGNTEQVAALGGEELEGEDEQRQLKLMLENEDSQQQQQYCGQKVTLITNGYLNQAQIKRHFKW